MFSPSRRLPATTVMPMQTLHQTLRLVLLAAALVLAGCASGAPAVAQDAPHAPPAEPADGAQSPSSSEAVAQASPAPAPTAERAPLERPGPEDVLRVFVADVGQGLGMFLVSPEGRVVVYDAGTRSGGANLRALMRQTGVERVDLAIMSHAHNDHLGGFIDIVDDFPTTRFLDPGFEHTSGVYLRLLNRLEELEIPIFLAEAGRRIRIDRFTEAEIIFPSAPFLTGTRSDVNSNSIVILLHFGEHRILLTGDAEEPTERRLLAEGRLVPVDVLQVAHHGSNHSSTPPFLNAVRPRIAVIGVGRGNSYGHPGDATLERLREAGVEAVYRTDLHGHIEIRTNGEILSVHPQMLP